ncbi:WD40 repeat domain-containing protein [Vacuolonema iberomarrocanum]|uniref:WD40 repeat domain-containing protein n=1 Tax=Vacuolonema iberomarrocanum TaxID=3454632 RepID=UPI0019F3FF31|nr:WD40 repeat domain-containing protein [filamentous cyanobacterium LEGE 07170]
MQLKPLLTEQLRVTLSDYVTAVAWSPIGNRLAAATGNGEVQWVHELTPEVLQAPTGQSINAIAFSADGTWLAAGGQAGCITLWKPPLPHPVHMLNCGSTWIDRLSWHPTYSYLAFLQGKTLRIWDAEQAEITQVIELTERPQDVQWSPTEDVLAIALKTNIQIWNPFHNTAPLYQWELTATPITVNWSTDGHYLACAMCDPSLSILHWSKLCHTNPASSDSKELPALMRGFPGKIRRLAWADIPDSDTSPMLAAATREVVAMWLLMPEKGWQSWMLDLHSQTVLDVAFQPKTGMLASASEDGWLILWHLAIEAMQVLDGAAEGFSCLAWHSSGQYLAAGGQQGELFVWSTGTDR